MENPKLKSARSKSRFALFQLRRKLFQCYNQLAFYLTRMRTLTRSNYEYIETPSAAHPKGYACRWQGADLPVCALVVLLCYRP